MMDDILSNDESLPLPALERIEKVCRRFEAAWKQGNKPRIEEYLDAAQGAERGELLRELLLLDVDYCNRSGQQPTADEYRARFPQDCQLVSDVFDKLSTDAAVGETISSPAGSFADLNDLPRIFGDYELLEEIAHGGMGVVYKARQISLNRLVAVKMILRGQLAGEAEVKRFHAEAEAAAKLQHPGIVAIHEVGVHQGQHYFSMDYIEGQSLAAIVRESPLPATKAAEYVRAIAHAVHYAHEQGVLHRDLKPSNVLIDANDQPRVTDFGLAKRIEEDSDLTATGEILGTASYMSPEQASGRAKQLDCTTDVYSLGAILYELLTGRPPFRGPTVLDTLDMVRQTEPIAPRSFAPHVPSDLATVCLKCLEKEPSRRYASADELADELVRYLQARPIRARPITPLVRCWRWCQRNRNVAVLGTLAILLVLALAVGGPIAAVMQASLKRRAVQLAAEKAALVTKLEAALAEVTRQQEVARRHLYNARTNLVQQFLAKGEIGPALALLQEQRPLSGEQDLRGFEWHYLWNTCQEGLELTLRGHTSPVLCVAYSPDGHTVASGDANGVVRLWDRHRGQEISVLRGHSGPVTCVVFSPNGSWLASGSYDRTVRLWEPNAGRLRGTLSGHRKAVLGIAFSPDSALLASGSEDHTVRLWDTVTGEPVDSPLAQSDGAHAVAFSPDGKTLASTAYGRIQLWDATTRQHVQTLSGHRFWIKSLAFAPDGTLFSGGNNRTVKAWDLTSAQPRTVLDERTSSIACIALSPDGRVLACGGGDGTILVRDLQSGDTQYFGHPDAVESIAFAPDGRTLVSGSEDCTVRVWSLDAPLEPLAADLERRVWRVTFSPDGKTLAASCDTQGIYVWDVSTEEPGVFIPAGSVGTAFSPDGKWLAAVEDWHMCLWDVATGDKSRVLEGRAGPTFGVAFSPDGTAVASVSQDGKVRIWDVAKGQLSMSWDAHSNWAWWIAFSPDGRWLASAPNWGAIKIWDATTGDLHVTLPIVCGSEPQAAFSPDGTVLASADSAGKIHLWNPETGQHMLEFSGNIRTDTRLAFAPDGNTLASSNDEGSVTLWDVETGQERSTLNKRGDWVYCLAFSPDGSTLVTGGDAGSVEFWRATRETEEASPASLPESRDELVRRVRARAALLERYGRWAEAQQSYSEAIELLEPLVVKFPDSDQYRCDLAESCLRLARLLIVPSETPPIHIEKAVNLAKRTVDLAPNQPDGWLTLGVALRKSGDFAQALPALQNAIALRRNVRGTDGFQLAMVHEQLGEHEEGEAAYRHALAWYLIHASKNEDVAQIARQTAELLDVAPHLRVPASPHERCTGLPSDLALFLDFAPDTVLQGCCANLVCDLSGSQNFGQLDGAEVVELGAGQFGLVCDGGQLRLREPLLNELKQYTVVGWLRKPPTADRMLLFSEYNPGGIVSEIALVGTHGILVAAWNRNTPRNWSHAHVQSPFCLNGQPIFLAVRFRESQDGSSAAIVTINDQTFNVSSQAVAYNGKGHAEIGGEVGIVERVAVFRRALSDDELNRIREIGQPPEEREDQR